MTQLQSEAAARRVRRVGSVGNRGAVWSDAQLQKLRFLWPRGVLVKNIAHDVGKTEAQVKRMRVELGLPARKKNGCIRRDRLAIALTPEEWSRLSGEAARRNRSVASLVRCVLQDAGVLPT